LIEEKKPWALAGAAALMLGFTINYAGAWNAWLGSRVTEPWKTAGAAAGTTKSEAERLAAEESAAKKELEDLNLRGKNLVQNVDGRLLWPELLRAINESLPTSPIPPERKDESIEAVQADISKRRDLHITSIVATPMKQEKDWFKKDIKRAWELAQGASAPAAAAESDVPVEEAPAEAAGDEEGVEISPKEAGYRIEIKGHHFHNAPNDPEGTGGTYVRQTLINRLLDGEIEVFSSAEGKTQKVRIIDSSTKSGEGNDSGDRGLGLKYPVMTFTSAIKPVPNPAIGRENTQNFKQPEQLQRFDFTIELWWRPATEADRKAALAEAAKSGGTADSTATAAISGTNEVQ
jgi:type IV pilus assembly protein PilM